MKVALKYCGSCNPQVDLAQVGRQVTALAQQCGWQLVALDKGVEPDVLVLLCGCPRTCINKEELYSRAKRIILVAGGRLGWRPVSEEELPSAVIGDIRGPSSP